MNAKFFYHLNAHRIFFWLFLAAFCCQILLWKKFEKFHTSFDVVPQAPNQYLVAAFSFGDNEFLFRALSMRLQSSGDVFAGFVALKNYDYSRIYDWMTMLDTLNNQSRLIPSLASYYYSQTTKIEDVHYVIRYLDEHASKNLDANWWWMFQAVFIAKDMLKDFKLALHLAEKLAQNNAANAPLWTKQLPAFISEKMGDGCLAFKSIQKLIAESESGVRKVSAEEMNFMRHFINDRLRKLKNQKFDPRQC
jgi:hypothetical protein